MSVWFGPDHENTNDSQIRITVRGKYLEEFRVKRLPTAGTRPFDHPYLQDIKYFMWSFFPCYLKIAEESSYFSLLTFRFKKSTTPLLKT
jgi:hypothetical protein